MSKLLEHLKDRHPYRKSLFTSNENEVARLLKTKGLTDNQITSVSGVMARYGYNACVHNVEEWLTAESEAGNE